MEESSHRTNDNSKASTTKALLEKFSKLDRDPGIGMPNYRADMEFSGNLREAISLSRNGPPGPPPLCSICQHKAPVFGKKKKKKRRTLRRPISILSCSPQPFENSRHPEATQRCSAGIHPNGSVYSARAVSKVTYMPGIACNEDKAGEVL
ncbi:hypothetical protein L3X38_026566 [Prunus dulcis]|uniref:Uncharacterized protein n=1 Tax=Prunus dulcis TaxID=3755 RepID=A0AAD4VL91_PRUDU|nr:hypothetical protein L3X38_026566 [Prunus dulcis]